MTTKGQRRRLLACALAPILLCAYLPGNWNERTAKEDPAKSDAIVIGRVIGIEMAGERLQERQAPDGKTYKHRERWYQARFRVGEVLKGSIDKDMVLMIPVGIDCLECANDAPLQDLTPAWGCLMMCNTQAAYDIRINQVYVMHLVKEKEEGWDLRSGPFSLGWIQPENKLSFGALGQKWQEPLETDKYLKELKDKLAAGRAPEPPR